MARNSLTCLMEHWWLATCCITTWRGPAAVLTNWITKQNITNTHASCTNKKKKAKEIHKTAIAPVNLWCHRWRHSHRQPTGTRPSAALFFLSPPSALQKYSNQQPNKTIKTKRPIITSKQTEQTIPKWAGRFDKPAEHVTSAAPVQLTNPSLNWITLQGRWSDATTNSIIQQTQDCGCCFFFVCLFFFFCFFLCVCVCTRACGFFLLYFAVAVSWFRIEEEGIVLWCCFC